MLEDLSIIIVTWNRDDFLSNCLGSIRSSCGDEVEIVVVDNANSNSTRLLVDSYCNVKYSAAERNLGFSGGNNLGLKGCTRQYILLLNNDTEIHKEPFSEMLLYLREHPDVMVVQGKMNMPKAGNVLDSCGICLTKSGMMYDRGVNLSSNITHVGSCLVFAAKGACLMFNRDVLRYTDNVLFHDHFENNYEDVDFCHRVWLSGWKVAFLNTPPVDHLCNGTIKRLNREKVDSQTLANHLFSFLTLFGPRGLCTILPVYLLLIVTIAIRFLACGQSYQAKVLCAAFRILWSKRRNLLDTRRTIQKNRRISDKELFSQVIVGLPLNYFWLRLRGHVSEFKSVVDVRASDC